MAYAFNDDKTKAKISGFFGGALLNAGSSEVTSGIFLSAGSTKQYTVKNDCFLIVLTPHVPGDIHAMAEINFNNGIGQGLYVGAVGNDDAVPYGPIPVKAGTIMTLKGDAAADLDIFVLETEILY